MEVEKTPRLKDPVVDTLISAAEVLADSEPPQPKKLVEVFAFEPHILLYRTPFLLLIANKIKQHSLRATTC